VTYDRIGASKRSTVTCDGTSKDGKFLPRKFQLKLADLIREIMSTMSTDTKKALDSIATLTAEITKSDVAADKTVVALLKDVTGQVTEACSRSDWFTRWGKHYLPSLMGAHLNQQCNNFKDPGVQCYGGTLFLELRDQLDELFLKLPPPKPSRSTSSSYSSSSSSHTSAPVNMSSYYNAGAPCFAGNCSVLMAHGNSKLISDIKKGDLVQTPTGIPAEVTCVIETKSTSGKMQLVYLPSSKSSSGLLITPWHPVRIGGVWKFPSDLGIPESYECPAVYNFVLSSEHVMIINDIECVTLGHGISGPVIGHAYFGSQNIIKDLQHMIGWAEGHVVLHSGCVKKDQKTGLVNGLVQHHIPI